MSDDTAGPSQLLEPIAYVSRSENRLEVLRALTETIPKPGLDRPGYEPRELKEQTGASEATVSRILNEYQDRGWAERNDAGEYTATPLGQSVALGFAPLMESMAAIRHLGDAVALLPLNELTIGLEHFRDASVREPQGPPSIDFGQYYLGLIDGATQIHTLVYVPADIDQAELDERYIHGKASISAIIPADGHEYMMETFGADRLRDMLEAGNERYVYDGHFPCNLTIVDDTVIIENSQVDGVQDGTVIESRNETVRDWALDVIERYRDEAEEITVEDLPA